VAIGQSALLTQSFSNGDVAWNSDNVAVGFEALYSNQPTSTIYGVQNTALGTQALRANTTGAGNTASGYLALNANTEGAYNTASGDFALYFNNTGNSNTAIGAGALFFNNTGSSNTAIGEDALQHNDVGIRNTAIGYNADVSASNLTNATAIGYNASVNASNTIVLGNNQIVALRCNAALSNLSDRTKKENFLPVDGAEVLRKIRGFELTSWNFIGQDKATMRHYGPMAQDFHAAFGRDAIGTSGEDTTINSGDLAGILMIAVQSLDKENAALKTQLAEREARDRERDERIARLERLLPAAPAGQKAGLQTASHHAR
jgi:hypothetical protein